MLRENGGGQTVEMFQVSQDLPHEPIQTISPEKLEGVTQVENAHSLLMASIVGDCSHEPGELVETTKKKMDATKCRKREKRKKTTNLIPLYPHPTSAHTNPLSQTPALILPKQIQNPIMFLNITHSIIPE